MSTPKPSYSVNGWQRLRTLCIAMRQTEEKVQKLKEDIETKLKITQRIRDKRSDIQASYVAIQSLEMQLEWRKGKVRTLSARLSKQRRNFGERDAKLLHFRKNVEENEERLNEKQRDYIAKREKLVWTGAQLCMRRKQLVQDVIFIYPIEEQRVETTSPTKTCPCKQILKISTVHMPDAESYAGHNEVDLSVGLDYVCHALDVLSRIFDIPFKYKLNYYGSRSYIVDNVDPNLPVNQSKFPLFCRGQDKNMYLYGVYLLNKNIAQFRCDCGVSTQDLRCTLLNLRSLMEYLSGARIEPFISRPLKINSSHSPVASSNSVESSTMSLTESGDNRSLYARERTGSYFGPAFPAANSSSTNDSTTVDPFISAQPFSNLRPSNSLEFPKMNGDCSSSLDTSSNNFCFTTDNWTADKCIEHNRKILRTCYFNADEFVEEEENHKNNVNVINCANGDILNPVSIRS